MLTCHVTQNCSVSVVTLCVFTPFRHSHKICINGDEVLACQVADHLFTADIQLHMCMRIKTPFEVQIFATALCQMLQLARDQ